MRAMWLMGGIIIVGAAHMVFLILLLLLPGQFLWTLMNHHPAQYASTRFSVTSFTSNTAALLKHARTHTVLPFVRQAGNSVCIPRPGDALLADDNVLPLHAHDRMHHTGRKQGSRLSAEWAQLATMLAVMVLWEFLGCGGEDSYKST